MDIEGIPQLRPSQLVEILKLAIPKQKKLLIVGPPGVGKTSIPKQVARELGYKIIIDHPVYGDPTDGKGIPWFDQEQKRAMYFPAGTLADVLSAKEPTLWLIDDFGQASPAVQASYMPPLLDRMVNGYMIPDCVSVLATTNARTHKAGVQGLLEPVKSRFDSIVGLDVNLDDSIEYFFNISAGNNFLEDAAIELIGFLKFRPNYLHNFQPTADLTNSPCPRTWEGVMRWVALFLENSISPDIEFAAIQGEVGKGAAAEYAGYQRVRRSLPPLDSILLDPDKARIPHDNPAAMYAVCVGLAEKATANNYDRVVQYANRMQDHKCKEHPLGLSQFAVLLLRDVFRRKPETCDTSTFIKVMSGPLGKMIKG